MRRAPRLKNRGYRVAKFTPRGGARALFVDPDLDESTEESLRLKKSGRSVLCRPEVLLEGPVGTGKTYCILEWVYAQMRMYKGIRVLFTRHTRSSMNETILKTWEEDVLGMNHKAVKGGANRENRHYYQLQNGSRANIIGINNWQKVMSGEYDIICYFEVVDEEREGHWESLLTRLRNQHIPHPRGYATKNGVLTDAAYAQKLSRPIPKHIRTIWDFRREGWFKRGQPLEGAEWPDGTPIFYHIQIGDCNPGHPAHWANKRCERIGEDGKPVMLRLLSRHEDNPTVTKDYLKSLRNLTGERRARFYEGKWVAASGAIYSMYSEERNVVDSVDGIVFDEYIIGLDFGFDHAGVLQVWGICASGIYMVSELYFSRWIKRRWQDAFVDLARKYKVKRAYADPSEADTIEAFNRALGIEGLNCRVYKAQNSILDGIDAMQTLLAPGEGLAPLMYFCRDPKTWPMGFCPVLKENGKATSVLEEINAYTWEVWKPGRSLVDKPAEGQADHGLDAARYIAIEVLGSAQFRSVVEAPKEVRHWAEEYQERLDQRNRKLRKRRRRRYA